MRGAHTPLRAVQSVPAGNDARPREGLVRASVVAELLDLTERWVLAEARSRRLPHYRLGRVVRFDLTEVQQYLEERHAGGLRIADPVSPRGARSHTASRGRVPTVTPPARLYPEGADDDCGDHAHRGRPDAPGPRGVTSPPPRGPRGAR